MVISLILGNPFFLSYFLWRFKCCSQEHITMTLARTWTLTSDLVSYQSSWFWPVGYHIFYSLLIDRFFQYFQVVSKLHVSETTIDSLNQQLVELSRSESLTRAKEQHESVTNAMKKKHEEQTLTLKQKLDEAILSRDCKVKKDNNVLHFLLFMEFDRHSI